MANDYDMILRENFGEIFLPLISRHLGIGIKTVTELGGKLHRTTEREPDFVKMVEPDNGRKFILHLEFQSTNDPNMMGRMRTYHALLMEKYRVPVRQIVLYIGQKPVRMRTKLKQEEIMNGYELLDLPRRGVAEFLDSEVMEEVILAVMADFEGRDPAVVVRAILSRLVRMGGESLRTQKALKQLLVLSRISNLDRVVANEIEDMPIPYDIKEHSLYQRGNQEAREKMAEEMLRSGELSLEKIARFSGLSMEEISAIRDRING